MYRRARSPLLYIGVFSAPQGYALLFETDLQVWTIEPMDGLNSLKGPDSEQCRTHEIQRENVS